MSFFNEYNPATGIVFEVNVDDIVNSVTGGGGASATTYQGLSVSDLLAAFAAGRIDAPTLQSELRGRTDANGNRLYSDPTIGELITSAREQVQQQAGQNAVATNPATATPGALMKQAVASEASAAAAPKASMGAGTGYGENVEQWRQAVMDQMPPQLRARPDAAMLVDKFLYTMGPESGGNPNAVGDGGAAYGLMQDHYIKPGTSPEQQIAHAWQLIAKNPDQWTDWGEGVTWLNPATGKQEPFGALGRSPYSNRTSSAGINATSAGGGATGGNRYGSASLDTQTTDAISDFLKLMQPRSDEIGFKAATGLPSAFPGLHSDVADMGQNFREQGLNADLLDGFAALRGNQGVPSSDWFAKLGLLPKVGMADGGTVGFADGGSVGPAGRSFEQITGTDYLSEAERQWYLEEVQRRGGNLGSGALSFLESRAAPPAPTPVISQLMNQPAQPTIASSRDSTPLVQAAAANVAAQSAPPTSMSPSIGSIDDNLRSSISDFLTWQQPRLDQLKFNARTGLPSDFPGIRVGLADLAQNARTQGLEGSRLNGFNEFAGGMGVPSSDYYRKLGFATGGDVEAYGATPKPYSPYETGPNREQGRPSAIDDLYNQSVQRFTGPYGTNVGLMGKAAQFGGFSNLSTILNNLNTVGRDFQGQDLSAGYRVPGFNSLQNEIYQRIFRTAPPSNVQYADGGTAGMGGSGVSTNPDGTPHLMLNEPATLVGNQTGTPYAVAGEVGTQEMVSPQGNGLQFTPTNIPQTPMQGDPALGMEQAAAMRSAVLSAVEQLLNGGNKKQRKGNYRPAPAGSSPAPSMLDSLMGAA